MLIAIVIYFAGFTLAGLAVTAAARHEPDPHTRQTIYLNGIAGALYWPVFAPALVLVLAGVIFGMVKHRLTRSLAGGR